MADYTYPGVYVEEHNYTTPVINGAVASSVGAFVGFSPRGQVGKPILVTSWTDFKNKFALGVEPFMNNAYLSYMVYGFFANGGQMAWIVRATDGSEQNATVEIANGTKPVIITAKDPGTWGNKLKVKIDVNAKENTKYDITVLSGTTSLETFNGVAVEDFVLTLNQNSKYVMVSTEATTFEQETVGTHVLSTGADGLSNITSTTLMEAVRKFDLVDTINLLVVAESQATALVTDAYAYAQNRKDCVFIFDGNMNDDFETIQQTKANYNNEYGELYFPWVQVNDPIGTVSTTKYIPCAGHVAGAIARNDSSRGIFKAPAGIEVSLSNVIGLKTVLNDAENGVLNSQGINCLRAFPDAGIVVWGARTTANTYLNVRRELNYIQSYIKQTTRWAVFEPNNEDTWLKITNQITEFLDGRYGLGAYRGASAEEAYFVKCDAELNNQAEINAGRINTEVGVAINKPGEFVIFRVGQWEGGTTVSE